MPYIKVNTNKFSLYQSELDSARQLLNRVRTSTSNIQGDLDQNVRYSNNINSNLSTVKGQLLSESNCILSMQRFLEKAAAVYDAQEEAVKSGTTNSKISILNTGDIDFHIGNNPISVNREAITIPAVGPKKVEIKADYITTGANLVGGAVDFFEKKPTAKFYDGYVHVSGYEKGSGYSSRYKMSTWVENQSKLSKGDKIGLAVQGIVRGGQAAVTLHNVWTDENKTTEKKVCDTVATATCTAAAIAIDVAGQVASNAVTACVSAIATPVVGFAVGFVVDKAIGIIADTVASEAVINQVSDSIENVVGATKAGCKAVSDKAKEVADAKGLDKVGKAAELVGTAVVETAKVAVTAVAEVGKVLEKVAVETVKNAAKAVVNTVKTVANIAKKIFKGW